jgi:hypothetical protein
LRRRDGGLERWLTSFVAERSTSFLNIMGANGMRDQHLSPVVAVMVAAITASRRIRRAVLVLAILIIASGGLMGVVFVTKGMHQHLFLAYITFLLGCGLLFWWLVACLLRWLTRIVAADVRDDLREDQNRN